MAVGQHVHLRHLDGGAQRDGLLHVVVVGNAANQHGVAHDSAVVARGQHRAVGIGEVVGEPRLRQVLVDERGDVVRRHRRRTGQREGAGGDVGEFGQVGLGGRGDVDGHGFYGSGAPGCQMFHCARCWPVCGLYSTTLVTRSR